MTPEALIEQGRVRLLAADSGLGAAVADRRLKADDEILTPVETIPKGVWEPSDDPHEGYLGFLVLGGLLTREVVVAQSRSMELIDSGDLLRPWQEDPSSYSTSRWEVLSEVRLAILGPEVAEQIAAYPELTAALVERAMYRTRNLALHWAIANTVGLERRIMLLFRHLAERWGRVTTDGIAIRVRMTHQLISDLVGARRPSVTTALSALAETGELSREENGGWLIASK